MPRRNLDQYYTPHSAVLALLDRYPHLQGTILECCSGELAIANALRQRGTVLTNDLDPLATADRHEDASVPDFWSGQSVDWVVTNPPFSCCSPIIVGAFRAARKGIAMLLRLSYLEPCKDRAEFLAEHPPSLIVLPRISFTGDGKTDNVTCAWMVWDFSEHKPTVHVVTKGMLKHLSNMSHYGTCHV